MLRRFARLLKILGPAVLASGVSTGASGQPPSAPTVPTASCNALLPGKVDIGGRAVGPEECLMQETDVMFAGRRFKRIDIGITGTVDGYMAKARGIKEESTGNREYIHYFTNAPDLVFPQGGNPGPILKGIGRYEAAKGTSVTVIYPLQPTTWNGKMWMTFHGRGLSFQGGGMAPWDKNLDPVDPMKDISQFERLMLEKGYAVGKTRRSSATEGGDVVVTLEDGSVVTTGNLNDHPKIGILFSLLTSNVVKQRLGRAPSRVYWTGHSAGARLSREMNFVPGLNRGPDGTPIVDGILSDDTGGGLWHPVVMKEGRDVLFASEADRAPFVPLIDVSHQLYNTESADEGIPDFVSNNFLWNKRRTARTLAVKGLGDRYRMYEVRGVSHDGGAMRPREGEGARDILPLWKLMDGMIDMIDRWVESGVAPPATRSDWLPLGDTDKDGILDKPAIALPEVACPLGVYYQYPVRPDGTPGAGVGTTAFADYNGQGLEPLDNRDVFVDMNLNRIRDDREALTQAWRRMGLIGPKDTLSRDRYVACVQASAEVLQKEGFISLATLSRYVEDAKKAVLPEEKTK